MKTQATESWDLAETLAAIPEPIWNAIWLVLTVALVALLFWWKTGSLHLIMARIWQVVFGKNKANDAQIDAFLKSQDDLMRFRFMSGMGTNVRTLDQVKRLLTWTNERDIGISEISRCGILFDFDALRVRGTALVVIAIGALATFAFALYVTLVASQIIAVHSVGALWLNWTDTDTQFALRTDSAQVVALLPVPDFRLKEHLAANDCATPPQNHVKRTGFSEDQIGELCKMFAGDGMQTSLQEAMSRQRLLVWRVLPFLLISVFIMAFYPMTRAGAAYYLRRRLNKRTAKEPKDVVEP